MRRLLPLLLLVPSAAGAACMATAPEPFEEFVEAFALDKHFAIARTDYPFAHYRHEVDFKDDKERRAIVKTSISKADDAAQPSMQAFASDNGLQWRTSSLQRTSAIARIEKPDTDWLLTCHFRRKGPCWYLRRIEDHSL